MPDALSAIHCYWVEPGVLLAGEYPGAKYGTSPADKLSALLDAGVRVFIDLTEHTEPLEPYEVPLRELARAAGLDVVYERHPIRDVSVPDEPVRIRGVLDALARARAARQVAYVHCWGGIGRTATVVGCLLREQGLAGDAALEQIRVLREGTTKAFRQSPETLEQQAYIRDWEPPTPR
jgi:protein-tyrosine phosphatase